MTATILNKKLWTFISTINNLHWKLKCDFEQNWAYRETIYSLGGCFQDPSGVGFQDEPEKVQNRAARFVTGNYNYDTGSMTGILEHLKWESLKKTEERQ